MSQLTKVQGTQLQRLSLLFDMFPSIYRLPCEMRAVNLSNFYTAVYLFYLIYLNSVIKKVDHKSAVNSNNKTVKLCM